MLEQLVLGYFRAYEEAQIFDFASPQEGRLGLNVIVGENNSGKSTAISIIREMFQQSSDFIVDSMSRVEGHAPVVSLSAGESRLALRA